MESPVPEHSETQEAVTNNSIIGVRIGALQESALKAAAPCPQPAL